MKQQSSLPRRFFSSSGQSLVEFALILPLLLVLALGVTEMGYALFDEHVVTRLTREGSNLISRDTSLQDAATAMRTMSNPPVDFTASSTMIFSVIKNVATTGAGNYNQNILYQRYQYGSFPAVSTLTTKGGGSFGGAPDYLAANSDNDTNLQLTNFPASMNVLGGMVYVTEIFSQHTLLTPIGQFGVAFPQTLYSIAYF